MIFRVGNSWTYIDGNMPDAVAKLVDEDLSFAVSGSKFAIDSWEEKVRNKMKFNAKMRRKQILRRALTREEELEIEEYCETIPLKYKWDGRQHFWDKRAERIPTGLVRRTIRLLKAHNVKYKIIDNRKMPPEDTQYHFKGITLHDDQQLAVDIAVQRQRGIVQAATGWGKCLGIGTKIIMYDGSTKNVEDLNKGDLLMGPDSKSREILSTTVGKGPLYKIVPKKGKGFICNGDHILSLKPTCDYKQYKKGIPINISVNDFLQKTREFQGIMKLWKSGVEFKEKNLPIDAYMYGLWLGDGGGAKITISYTDEEIFKHIKKWCDENNYTYSFDVQKSCYTLYIGNHLPSRSKKNILLEEFHLHGKKNGIRKDYLFNSRENRLKLLAGLIDSDGHNKGNCYEISSVHKKLIKDIVYLSQSLGFMSYMKKGRKKILNGKLVGPYYRISISGDLSCIPCLLPRKKCTVRKQKKNVLNTGIKKIESLGVGKYYGFTLDGDGLFLLGDFTVTHNTEVIAKLIHQLRRKTLVVIHRETIFQQLQKRLMNRLGVPVGVVGGGVHIPYHCTVAMMQTITKPQYEDFIKSFPVVIVDECHHIAAQTMYSIVMNSNAFFRYGFSATPWRDDNADLYIEAALSRFIVNITPSQLVNQGRLAKPYVFFIHNPLIPQFNKLSWQKQYTKCIVENEYRNRMIINIAYAMWKRRKTFLIAVTQIKHGKNLLHLMEKSFPKIKIRFVKGEDETTRKQETLTLLNDRKIHGVIATSVYGEGIDCPTLDCIINGKGQESKIDVIQLIGRGLRITKTKFKAFFVDFLDQEKYTKAHSTTRFKILSKEEAFQVKSLRSVDELEKQMDSVEEDI